LRFSQDIVTYQGLDRRKRAWAYFGGPTITDASFEAAPARAE
jgi:hypothetical protein